MTAGSRARLLVGGVPLIVVIDEQQGLVVTIWME